MHRWPDAFGGAWLQGRKVVVAFTQGNGRKLAKLRRTFPPGRRHLLRTVRVETPLAELRSFQAAAIARRETPDPDLPSYDLDVDVKANRVVAIVEDASPRVIERLRLVHGDGLEVRQGELVLPEACLSRVKCTPDLRSGLKTTPQAGGGCSTAFVVRSRKGFDGILSAAHCGEPDADLGSTRSHNATTYGKVVAEQQFGNIDAELHRDTGPLAADQPLVYVDEKFKAGLVLRSSDYASLLVGFHICKSGQITGQTCGKVQSVDYAPDSVPWSHQFIKASYCSNPGDSGAGVYQKINFHSKPTRYDALGIHSSGPAEVKIVNGTETKIPRLCPDPLDFGVFGHVEFAKRAFSLAVRQSPLKP